MSMSDMYEKITAKEPNPQPAIPPEDTDNKEVCCHKTIRGDTIGDWSNGKFFD